MGVALPADMKPSEKISLNDDISSNKKGQAHQWIILVLVIGGRDYITPYKAIYACYISGTNCQ